MRTKEKLPFAVLQLFCYDVYFPDQQMWINKYLNLNICCCFKNKRFVLKMAVAPIGQTEQAAFRKIWVVGLVWFLVFFRPPPPQEIWFNLGQKKFRKSGQGRLTVKWGKMCVYRVVVIVVYALSCRHCVLGGWINKAVFWVANLLVAEYEREGL